MSYLLMEEEVERLRAENGRLQGELNEALGTARAAEWAYQNSKDRAAEAERDLEKLKLAIDFLKHYAESIYD